MKFIKEPDFTQSLSPKPQKFEIPNPSSIKDILQDTRFITNLQKRLRDENEDLKCANKFKRMSTQIKYVASGLYGNNIGSWNYTRCDTAARERNLKRMNRNIRIQNLENMVNR